MKIAVLGGGISGLSAAWYARKKYPHAKIELFEKTNRLGGWIHTQQVGSFLFERGPRTFQTNRSPHLLSLIDELGLSNHLIHSSGPTTRYLLKNGKLRSIQSFWPTILKGIFLDLCMPKGNLAEETIASFFTRRFGAAFTSQLIDPLVTGVFGGKSDLLSLEACFPTIAAYKQTHRSCALAAIRRQKNSLFTLKGGMQTLLQPLASAINTIHFKSSLSSLPPADLVISALPPAEISHLTQIPLAIRTSQFSVVNMGFHQDHLAPSGYGYLVPSKENDPIMGMIWDSSIFPTSGQTKLTAMVRSATPEEAALLALQQHLHIHAKPDVLLVQDVSIPQFDLGHLARVAAFQRMTKKNFPNLSLVGNWIGGASVDDCVRITKIFH